MVSSIFPFLKFSITSVVHVFQGSISSYQILTIITLKISILPNRYHVFGLTFQSAGHYRGAVMVNGVWHHYDGLWERNTRGQGLQTCTGKPCTPQGFLLSHCVYYEQVNTVVVRFAFLVQKPFFMHSIDVNSRIKYFHWLKIIKNPDQVVNVSYFEGYIFLVFP